MSASKSNPQPNSHNTVSTYIGIFVLTAVIIALGIVAVTSVLDSDESTTQRLNTSETTEVFPTEDMLEEESSMLEQVPFDTENPNVEEQIDLIETELDQLEGDLIEQELEDDQLGIE